MVVFNTLVDPAVAPVSRCGGGVHLRPGVRVAVSSAVRFGVIAAGVAVGRRSSCSRSFSSGRGRVCLLRMLDAGVREPWRVGQPLRGFGAVANDNGVARRGVVLLLPGYDMVSDPLAARFVEFPGPH